MGYYAKLGKLDIERRAKVAPSWRYYFARLICHKKVSVLGQATLNFATDHLPQMMEFISFLLIKILPNVTTNTHQIHTKKSVPGIANKYSLIWEIGTNPFKSLA